MPCDVFIEVRRDNVTRWRSMQGSPTCNSKFWLATLLSIVFFADFTVVFVLYTYSSLHFSFVYFACVLVDCCCPSLLFLYSLKLFRVSFAFVFVVFFVSFFRLFRI